MIYHPVKSHRYIIIYHTDISKDTTVLFYNISHLYIMTQESILARHLAKSKQDACAYKILQDGRFDKIEQEDLARSCKYMQDPSYAR
jgi:hypothetical protein